MALSRARRSTTGCAHSTRADARNFVPAWAMELVQIDSGTVTFVELIV